MAYTRWQADWKNLPDETTPITEGFLDHIETALDTQDDRIVVLEGGGAGIPASTVDAKGDLIGGTAADTVARVPAGTVDGHVLTRSSAATTGMAWAAQTGGSGIQATIVDAKGDLIGGTAADTVARVPAGTVDGHVLTRAASATTGMVWQSPPAGGSSAAVNGVVYLNDFGGSSNAGTAMNNAIAALPGGGGTVIVPAGVWTVDVPILINKNGVTIKGVSNLSSELQYSPGTISTVIANADTTQRFVNIRDLFIDSTGISGGTAINASYFVNSFIERIRIGDGTTRPQRGIVFDALGTYYNTVRDCRINVAGVGSVGLYYANQSNSNWAQNVRILGDDNTVGVDVVNVAHTNTLAHIDCEGTMGIGIRVGGYNTTLISPYIESITVGLQILRGVESFSCLGGIITECDTLNIDDQGADKPVFAGVWLQYDTYSRFPDEPFKRTAQVLKDPGAATITALGTPAPTLSGHTSVDSSSGAFMDFATSTILNNTVGAISPFTVCRRDWDPRVDFRFRMGSSTTSIRVLMGLFSASPDAVPTPETIHGAWFRYDTSVDGTVFWRCVVAAGAAPLVVTTAAPVEINTANSFRIELNESIGRAIFFIDDAQVARISGASLPGLTELLGWGVRVTTLTTASRNARWGATQIRHD